MFSAKVPADHSGDAEQRDERLGDDVHHSVGTFSDTANQESRCIARDQTMPLPTSA